MNRVSGRCFNPDERWQLLPYPAVQDAALIAQEGNTYPLEENFDGVNHPAHAQHLGTIAIRQSQASLRMQLSCNVSAHRLELFDYGGVTLPRFGMASKGFEVVGWRWHPTEGVQLTLAEIGPEIFVPVAELRGIDPAPNSNLPDPRNVAQLLAVGVVSGTAALTDGSILTRTRVTWDAATQPGVRNGGSIEVQYVELTAMPAGGDWPSWREEGSATSATIPGLRVGRVYVFRVRAVQSLPLVRGRWSRQVVHQIAAAPLVEAEAGWLNSNVTLAANGTLQGAGGGQVTLPGLGHVVYRCVSAGLNATQAGTPPAAVGLYINGVRAFVGGRSYHVTGIRRTDGAVVYSGTFDVYGDAAAPGAMAAALNALDSNHLVVVYTDDEPRASRGADGLDVAMYRCGASRAVFGSTQFKGRAAYILLGIAGCGEGNGAEAYQGTVDNDPLAWCDLSFAVVNGVLTGVSGTYTPRSLADYGYTGDLNATAGAPAGTMVGTVPAENVESVAGAQAKANAAAALANAAQQAANAANQALADIASDSVLSRGEKPQLVLDVETIAAEAAGIDAQAAAFGVTVQRTEYAQARTDLFSYLAGLSPAFSDLTTDTPINGPVLRGLFGVVYGKRQALLNQVSALAAQRAVWSQVQGVNVTTAQLDPAAATEVVEFYQAVGINFSNMA